MDEQKIICTYLDIRLKYLDTLVDKVYSKIGLLTEQRTAIVNHFITKGLDPNVEMKDSGVEWIGSIPDDLYEKIEYGSFDNWWKNNLY